MSPTTRSLAKLRADGWLCWVVERYIAPIRRRIDLWHIADILALRGTEIMAVQTTSASNVAARVRKITESEHVAAVREAGIAIVVHGWRKVRGRWVCREVDLS